MSNPALNALRHHVSGAIERGEKVAIVEQAPMTQERWNALSKSEREAMRDNSDLNPALVPYIGKRVRVAPKREYGLTTFRVGITTGWKPRLLAMRNDPRQRGSSDLIGVDEVFTSITVIRD